MEILKKDADEIVTELSKLINLKFNIVGNNAVIIANSDVNRVGDFHEATHQIIQNNLEELMVYNDNQYKGTCSGINLPLVIDNAIIGVIGITGPYNVAKTYAKIVKKMTEIMLQSRADENRIMNELQAKERYLQSWVCNNKTIINDAFITQGYSYDIDITKPRRIMVISNLQDDNSPIVEKVKNIVHQTCINDYIFLSPNSVVAILMERGNEKLRELANQIIHDLSEDEIYVHIGIDSKYHSFTGIHEQYRQAKTALYTASRLKVNQLVFFDDLNLELILHEIPIEAKVRYIKKIFVDYSPAEIQRDAKSISVFYQENGSINNAAKRLIVHPNTLQYQLKKIKEKTGCDPRKLKCASIFGIALLFVSELEDNMAEFW